MALSIVSCGPSGNQEADLEKIDKAYRLLAINNCGSCHKFPEPELLDKETWRTYVLPRMAHFYGIYADDNERNSLIEEGTGGDFVQASNVFPESRTIDSLTWHRISQYYLHNAPDKMDKQEEGELALTKIFEVKTPDLRLSPPSSTMIGFMEPEGFIVGDANTEAVYFLDQNLELEKVAHVREGAVDIHSTESDWWVTVMGSFSPTDASSGIIIKLPKDGMSEPEIVVSGLQRPVNALYADFNQDGFEDIVVSEFGKWTGSLSLFLNRGDDTFSKTVLEDRCGASTAESRDINGDGLLDIIALFGQGIEAIEAFINQGDGSFQMERILEFEPSYGSSSFGLYDLDGDGDEDIVYTAGDNADYLPILKPYHGVYLFTNDGQYNFTQTDFLPQNGAFKAVPSDFDGDGDLDIASISFFPDYANQPNEGFVLFENKGGSYERRTIDNLKLGRWISMDISDYDKDGDEDLILGSLAFETVPVQQQLESIWINSGIPFVLLENQTN